MERLVEEGGVAAEEAKDEDSKAERFLKLGKGIGQDSIGGVVADGILDKPHRCCGDYLLGLETPTGSPTKVKSLIRQPMSNHIID